MLKNNLGKNCYFGMKINNCTILKIVINIITVR